MLKMVGPKELKELENQNNEKSAQEALVELTPEQNEKMLKRSRLRQKIISLGKMKMMMSNLRANAEVIL